MRKRMTAFLSIGIFGVLLGVIGIVLERINVNRLAGIGVGLRIVPVLIVAISSAWIAVVISTRGGTGIRDEMVIRVESMSGKYSFDASLFFIMALGIANFFYSLPLSISELLLTLMVFMSFTFILIRYFLMIRGKAE
jgi:hypothetical protein